MLICSRYSTVLRAKEHLTNAMCALYRRFHYFCAPLFMLYSIPGRHTRSRAISSNHTCAHSRISDIAVLGAKCLLNANMCGCSMQMIVKKAPFPSFMPKRSLVVSPIFSLAQARTVRFSPCTHISLMRMSGRAEKKKKNGNRIDR